jgi:hypothetical protein
MNVEREAGFCGEKREEGGRNGGGVFFSIEVN